MTAVLAWQYPNARFHNLISGALLAIQGVAKALLKGDCLCPAITPFASTWPRLGSACMRSGNRAMPLGIRRASAVDILVEFAERSTSS